MDMRPNLEANAAWKRRFRAPSIAWVQMAFDNPDRGLVCSDRDGIYQLYAWDVPSGELRRLTDRPVGVLVGTLSTKGEYVYYMQDDGGNEIGHFVRVPFSGGEPEDLTPTLPPYGSFQISESRDGKLLGSRVTDPSGQMLYVFALGQTPRLIHKSQSHFFGPAFSYHGELGVIATAEGTGSTDTRLVVFDLTTGESIAELWDGQGVGHRLGEFAPQPGDFRFLTTTSKSGFVRPLIWNPKTGERRDLAVDQIPGEVVDWFWFKDGRRILLSYLHRAEQAFFLYDLETDTATPLDTPEGTLGSFEELDGKILATWQDASHPASLIALDPQTGQRTETVLSFSDDVPAGHPWTSVSFDGAKDEVIQAWLATPEGEGPFPTILHTHGGPTAATVSRYSPEVQAWIDHGFAFFSVNYHGSTTFGKDFEKSINGRLGELEVEDMAAGARWLVEEGVADPSAIFLTGGSYGGYLTLLALGKEPGLWAGGMASVAIADWTVMYEDESESLRGYQRMLFGGTPEETPEAHKKSSPSTYAEHIQAPIMVLQGSNDTRCPARQMKVYEEKLKSLGKQIDVHWFDAGHGSRAQEQNIEHLELKLRFAFDVLNRTT